MRCHRIPTRFRHLPPGACLSLYSILDTQYSPLSTFAQAAGRFALLHLGQLVVLSLPKQKGRQSAPLLNYLTLSLSLSLTSFLASLGGRYLVQRIPTFAVPESIAGLGLDITEDKVVDVAADESVDDEAHLESVGGNDR